MNRRGFLGLLGLAAAAPVVAKVIAEPRDFETAMAQYKHREYAMGFEIAPVKREGDAVRYDQQPPIRHIRIINKGMNPRPMVISVKVAGEKLFEDLRIRRGEFVDWYGYLYDEPKFRMRRGRRGDAHITIERERSIATRTL